MNGAQFEILSFRFFSRFSNLMNLNSRYLKMIERTMFVVGIILVFSFFYLHYTFVSKNGCFKSIKEELDNKFSLLNESIDWNNTLLTIQISDPLNKKRDLFDLFLDSTGISNHYFPHTKDLLEKGYSFEKKIKGKKIPV